MLVKKIIIIVCIFSVSLATAKRLYIEITGGKYAGTPIAILPFKVDSSSRWKHKESDLLDIAEVIRNDLGNTAQFNAVAKENFVESLSLVSSANKFAWRQAGVDLLLAGNVTYKCDNKYNINFELLDLRTDSKKLGVIYSHQFSKVDKKQFRQTAHLISDNVFNQITATRGHFSSKIAYITVDEAVNGTLHTLYIADSDGQNEHLLFSSYYPLMSPRWSPDGRNLAFVAFKGNRSSIMSMDLVTGKLKQWSNFPGINGAPSWSVDGKKMALVLSKDGAPNLYLMNLEDKKLERLTKGVAIDTEPCFSPDGEYIYFTSNRGGKPQIYRLQLSSKKVVRVTFTGKYNATPSITPDGQNLVMLHQDDRGAYNIAVQNLNNSKVTLLTNTGLNESPSLSANGTMIMYGIQDGRNYSLGAISLDGSFKMKLPTKEGYVKEPVWSPFLKSMS